MAFSFKSQQWPVTNSVRKGTKHLQAIRSLRYYRILLVCQRPLLYVPTRGAEIRKFFFAIGGSIQPLRNGFSLFLYGTEMGTSSMESHTLPIRKATSCQKWSLLTRCTVKFPFLSRSPIYAYLNFRSSRPKVLPGPSVCPRHDRLTSSVPLLIRYSHSLKG